MKKLLLPLLLVLACAAQAAEPAPDPKKLEEGKKILGMMLDQYATVAGGWYLEKKCNFLDPKLKKEYENNIAADTVGMRNTLKVPDKMLHQIQQAGKDTAESDRWKCDKEGRDIVVHTVLMARDLHTKLDKIAAGLNKPTAK